MLSRRVISATPTGGGAICLLSMGPARRMYASLGVSGIHQSVCDTDRVRCSHRVRIVNASTAGPESGIQQNNKPL